MTTVYSKVEWVKAKYLREGERKALKRISRVLPDTKVTVCYANAFPPGSVGTVHEPDCEANVIVNLGTGEVTIHTCTCKSLECGEHGTVRIERHVGPSRPVLWRFVPRPLTLEQAVEFEEVDNELAAVMADMLLASGKQSGERITLMLAKR